MKAPLTPFPPLTAANLQKNSACKRDKEKSKQREKEAQDKNEDASATRNIHRKANLQERFSNLVGGFHPFEKY